jgi:hypothetical protein
MYSGKFALTEKMFYWTVFVWNERRCLTIGVGGPVDFPSGAGLCPADGKPILALPSSTKKGESKVVPYLKQGIVLLVSKCIYHVDLAKRCFCSNIKVLGLLQHGPTSTMW